MTSVRPARAVPPRDACPACGWPVTEPYRMVSRHRSTAGTVVYVRCPCGTLHVLLAGGHGQPVRVVVRGSGPGWRTRARGSGRPGRR